MISDFIVRVPTLADAPGAAEVHVRSWQTSYKGILPDEFLKSLSFEQRLASHRMLIGQTEKVRLIVEQMSTKKIVGFSNAGESRENEFSSELYAIYLIEEFKGLGLGRMLFQRTFEELHSKKFKNSILWVLKDNSRARKFYETMGGELYSEKQVEIGKVAYPEVSYVWRNLDQFKI